jgi:hypothetical protein
LKSAKIVCIIKVLILLNNIGFPNNKHLPNTKNYLRWLLFVVGVVVGGRDYCQHQPENIKAAHQETEKHTQANKQATDQTNKPE